MIGGCGQSPWQPLINTFHAYQALKGMAEHPNNVLAEQLQVVSTQILHDGVDQVEQR